MNRTYLNLLSLAVTVGGLWCGQSGSTLSGQSVTTNMSVSGRIGDHRKAPASGTLSSIFNAEAAVSERLKAVHSLRNDLNASEIREIQQFLKARPAAREKNLPALQLIKNDLLNALIDQNTPPAELTDTLIGIYNNPGQDYVTRDYAIQHLVTWYQRGAGETAGVKSSIRATLKEAAQANTSIGGTALLGMHRLLATGDPAFNRDEIRQRSVAMADSAETVITARITAIQVCAEEGTKEVLPMIRSLAQAESPTALRISAIAALGRLGDQEDISLLVQMAASPDSGLRPAIQTALTRLQQEFHRQKLASNLN